MQFVINLGNLDLKTFREQRKWLRDLPACDERDGLLNLLDHVADEIADKYNQRKHLHGKASQNEPLKGIEVRVPERFYRGTHPHAETVGDLLAILSELPQELPIDGDFGKAVEICVSNIGHPDLRSSLQIQESDAVNDALLSWACSKEEGNDFYTRESCHYCEGNCHIHWLQYGDAAEHLCDGYQADEDNHYEREDDDEEIERD